MTKIWKLETAQQSETSTKRKKVILIYPTPLRGGIQPRFLSPATLMIKTLTRCTLSKTLLTLSFQLQSTSFLFWWWSIIKPDSHGFRDMPRILLLGGDRKHYSKPLVLSDIETTFPRITSFENLRDLILRHIGFDGLRKSPSAKPGKPSALSSDLCQVCITQAYQRNLQIGRYGKFLNNPPHNGFLDQRIVLVFACLLNQALLVPSVRFRHRTIPYRNFTIFQRVLEVNYTTYLFWPCEPIITMGQGALLGPHAPPPNVTRSGSNGNL